MRLSNLKLASTWQRLSAVSLGVIASISLCAPAAIAHHPFGGQLPENALQGLLSGLGHPVIGIDHLTFTIALGGIAALQSRPASRPTVIAAFLIAAAIGTGIHLQAWDLPIVEIAIAASVLLLGLLLLARRQYDWRGLSAIAAIAGIFHGYAYGEAVVGAEPTPLVAYLLGFTAIQAAIAWASGTLVRHWSQRAETRDLPNVPPLIAAGGAISGVGFAFLSQHLLG